MCCPARQGLIDVVKIMRTAEGFSLPSYGDIITSSVRGSPITEVMVLEDVSEGFMSSWNDIHNAKPRQFKWPVRWSLVGYQKSLVSI